MFVMSAMFAVSPGHAVVNQHESRNQNDRHERGHDAAVDRVPAQCRRHVVGGNHRERRAQRILEHRRKFLRFRLRKMPGNLAPVVNFAVDARRGVKPAVQNNGQQPADVVAGDFSKALSGRVGQSEFNQRFTQIAAAHLSALDDVTGEARFRRFAHDNDFRRLRFAVLGRFSMFQHFIAGGNRLKYISARITY